MLAEAAGRGQHFQARRHSFSLYGPTLSRPIAFFSLFFPAVNWLANEFIIRRVFFSSFQLPKRVFLQIIFCSCVIGTTFSREKWQIASLSCQEVIKIWKQSWWSNDKTIIELGYHKISWFVSVLQINYLPQPLASANKLTCSPLTNHDILFNLVQ